MLPRDVSPSLSPHAMPMRSQLPHVLAGVAIGADPLVGAPNPVHGMRSAALTTCAVESGRGPAEPPLHSHAHTHAASARAGASGLCPAAHLGATCVSSHLSAPHAIPLGVGALAASPSGTARASAGASELCSAEHLGVACVSSLLPAPHAIPLGVEALAAPPSGTARACAGASASRSAEHQGASCVSLMHSAPHAGPTPDL